MGLARTIAKLAIVAWFGVGLPPSCAQAEIAPGTLFATSARLGRPSSLLNMLGDPVAWRHYQVRFVEASGRVIDTANVGVSHSEGQGYGMLLAVAAGDHDTFRRIWSWTRTRLPRSHDALNAWLWNPAGLVIGDSNNATDGDILIAWALGEADEAWPNEGYRTDAHRIATDIARQTFLRTRRYGTLLLPAAFGFTARDRTDGPVVNLSYWIFPAFPRLAAVAPEFDWAAIVRSGLKLIQEARFGPARLPTDWVAVGGDAPQPAVGWPATFSYNAIRIPLYLAMAGDRNRDDYAPFNAAWARSPSAGLPIIESGTGQSHGWMQEPGYTALAAAVRCVVTGGSIPDDIFQPSEGENYYPATLGLLARLALRMHFQGCLVR